MEERIMSKGRFGIHGGQYISETLMNELIRLEEAYEYLRLCNQNHAIVIAAALSLT